MQQVIDYIKQNIAKTFRPNNDHTPYPFVSPTVDKQYEDFYYWDTYFQNLGLMLLGHTDYVEHDLDNIAWAINKYGYMPNALVWHSLDRSQPPFFTRMVYSYYKFCGNREVVEKYIESILKEHEFWRTKRMTSIGLNAYGCEDKTTADLIKNGYIHHDRVRESADTDVGKAEIGKNLLAIAESGLDFNMRFRTADSNISADRFAHLDLNCILYEAEVLTSEMLDLLGRNDEASDFAERAKNRKRLVDKYLWCDEQGIYLDYNYIDGTYSTVLSAASLYPFAFGLSDDNESAQKVLTRLELPYGISACEFRGDDALYFQWDYPCIWPAATMLSYQAFQRLGLHDIAQRIAQKYMAAVDKNYLETGRLWEKYDGRDGSIAVTTEYATPPFFGWTAAVYVVFAHELKEQK